MRVRFLVVLRLLIRFTTIRVPRLLRGVERERAFFLGEGVTNKTRLAPMLIMTTIKTRTPLGLPSEEPLVLPGLLIPSQT